MAQRSKKLAMPDLVGLNVDTANKVLSNAGLREGDVFFVEGYESADTVVSQEPPKGHLVDANMPVTLRISKRNFIRFLPTIYQNSATYDNPFLKQYLWLFQTILESVTKKIDNVHELFDPFSVSEEFLPWLASWLALVFEGDWPVHKKRILLKRIAIIYRIRGTARAIREMIRLFTGYEPEIIENSWPYKGFRIGIHSGIGIDSIILPEMDLSFCFVLKMPVAFKGINEDILIRIHKIIQNEKPAHTNYFLQFKDEKGVSEYRGMMWIGVDSRIETVEEEKKL